MKEFMKQGEFMMTEFEFWTQPYLLKQISQESTFRINCQN